MNVSQKSMLEVTIELMGKKRKPQKATDLIKDTLELKGITDADGSLATQLYVDITTSALFVYCGEGEWDLKERQDISLWDKDGSFFSNGIIEEDDEDEITADDYELASDDDEFVDIDDEDDTLDTATIVTATDDDDEDIVDIDDTFIPYSTDYDDDTISESFLDEDKYNDYMDDYEELYDDK